MPKQRSVDDPAFLWAKNSGELIWILLANSDFPLRDGKPKWTIGFWQDDEPAGGYWIYVGWCWTHDHFVNRTTQLGAHQDRDRSDNFIVGWAKLEWPGEGS